jgi:hypothetical protein
MMIEEVKTHFSIAELAKELFPNWQPAKLCRSPFRKDLTRNPSFSVYTGRDGGTLFMDFETGERGDVIDFYALARGVSTAEALLELWDRLQAGEGYVARPLKAHFHEKLDLDVRRPTHDDPFALPYSPSNTEKTRMRLDCERLLSLPQAIEEVASCRDWDKEIVRDLALEGVLGLSAERCITFHFLSGSKSRWLDSNGKRRFRWNFGKPWFWRGDLIWGADKIWIVEGETKAIRALCWGYEKHRRVIALPSASFDCSPWAFLFKEKEVAYISDPDRAGQRCAQRVFAALKPVAKEVAVLDPGELAA